jgi:hypothetical protein
MEYFIGLNSNLFYYSAKVHFFLIKYENDDDDSAELYLTVYFIIKAHNILIVFWAFRLASLAVGLSAHSPRQARKLACLWAIRYNP